MALRSISFVALLIGLSSLFLACSDTTSTDSSDDVPSVAPDTAIDFSLDLENDPKPDSTGDVSSDSTADVGEDNSPDSPVDTGEDTGVDSPTDVAEDTGSDLVEDTGRDLPSEPDTPDEPTSDTDLEVVDDPPTDEEPVDPSPITFIIRNATAEKVYLDGYTLLTHLVDIERTSGGAWITTRLWSPFCTVACDDVTSEEMCCIACMPAPTVKVLPPGGEESVTWDGENTFVIDNDHCACGCYRPAEVPLMAYRAKGCVYHTMNCWGDVCTPDVNGMIFGAGTTGEPSCATVNFDLPYSDGTVLIEIE